MIILSTWSKQDFGAKSRCHIKRDAWPCSNRNKKRRSNKWQILRSSSIRVSHSRRQTVSMYHCASVTKTCSKCQRQVPSDRFHSKSGRLDSKCKSCVSSAKREIYQRKIGRVKNVRRRLGQTLIIDSIDFSNSPSRVWLEKTLKDFWYPDE